MKTIPRFSGDVEVYAALRPTDPLYQIPNADGGDQGVDNRGFYPERDPVAGRVQQFEESYAPSGGGLGVDAEAAWDQYGAKPTMSNFPPSEIIMAALDTGADLRHPDLTFTLWRNGAEICGNGLDDDNNGYVDDCHGVDTVGRRQQRVRGRLPRGGYGRTTTIMDTWTTATRWIR